MVTKTAFSSFVPSRCWSCTKGAPEEGACNYNPLATTDDDSCVFDDGIYGCDGECFNDEDGDGICDENEIEGCTGKGACNYNADATDDDDSCFYPGEGCDDGFELTVGDVMSDNCECLGYSCYDETACNYSTEGIEDNSVCSYISQYEVVGKHRSILTDLAGLHVHGHCRVNLRVDDCGW